MIRLSEALARVHADTLVRPKVFFRPWHVSSGTYTDTVYFNVCDCGGKYVIEAARLLRKSIIHVDSPDVDFRDQDAEEDQGDEGGGGGGGDDGGDDGDGGDGAGDDDGKAKKKEPEAEKKREESKRKSTKKKARGDGGEDEDEGGEDEDDERAKRRGKKAKTDDTDAATATTTATAAAAMTAPITFEKYHRIAQELLRHFLKEEGNRLIPCVCGSARTDC